MWFAANFSQCLQDMSNEIVQATYLYITPNQTIPSWVYDLPEPLRSQKIGMIILFFKKMTVYFVDYHPPTAQLTHKRNVFSQP
jgi:hypothetical protein